MRIQWSDIVRSARETADEVERLGAELVTQAEVRADADRARDDDLDDDREGDCPRCEGSGAVVCDAFGCEGSGCPLCIDGEMSCPDCGGSGFLPVDDMNEET